MGLWQRPEGIICFSLVLGGQCCCVSTCNDDDAAVFSCGMCSGWLHLPSCTVLIVLVCFHGPFGPTWVSPAPFPLLLLLLSPGCMSALEAERFLESEGEVEEHPAAEANGAHAAPAEAKLEPVLA